MSEQAAILVSVCAILYFPCDTDFWQCQDGCGWISCCDCCKAPDFMGGGAAFTLYLQFSRMKSGLCSA